MSPSCNWVMLQNSFENQPLDLTVLFSLRSSGVGSLRKSPDVTQSGMKLNFKANEGSRNRTHEDMKGDLGMSEMGGYEKKW